MNNVNLEISLERYTELVRKESEFELLKKFISEVKYPSDLEIVKEIYEMKEIEETLDEEVF